MVVFDSPLVQAIYEDYGSEYLLITFGTIATRADGRGYFGKDVAARARISTLAFVATEPNWYPVSAMREAEAAVRHILDSYSERVVYGYSMGAYGAIKHAGLFRANTTVAVAPQYTINPADVAPAYRQYGEYYRPHLHADMRIGPDSQHGRIYVLYDDKLAMDDRHVALIAQNVEISRIKLPYTTHNVMRCFAGTKVITELFDLCRAGDGRAVQQYARVRRKTNPIRIHGLCQALAVRHLRWALAVHDRYAALLDAEVFVQLTTWLGHYATHNGVYDWALKAHGKALDVDADNIAAHRGMLNVYTARGDLPAAIEWARKIVTILPQIDSHEALVVLLMKSGDLPAARIAVDEAIERFPGHAGLLFRSSDIEIQLGASDTAVERARGALASDPTQPFRREWLGRVLARSGQLDEAAEHFRAVLADNPRHPGCLHGLADTHARRGALPAAIARVRELIAAEQPNVRTHAWLIGLLLVANDLAGAGEALSAALLNFPGDAALAGCAADVERRMAAARMAGSLESSASVR